MNRNLIATASLLASCLVAAPCLAQSPSKKKPAVGTLGTAQMAGGDGLFGTTYTVANSGGYVYNVTIASAEYIVGRFNISDNGNAVIPHDDEKLLLLHLRLQNPTPGDMYVSSTPFGFSTVGLDDVTRDLCSPMRLMSSKKEMGYTLKPGQKFPEEMLLVCTVPAVGPVPKLIMNIGRKGTKDLVIRFPLGKSPNAVTPLSAVYADPTNRTGTTARAQIPAKQGVVYSTGCFDLQMTSAAYVAGAIGETKPDDGGQLFVATFEVTNKVWQSHYTNDFVSAKLSTDDDEKTDKFELLKGKRDEPYEGRQVDPDEKMTVRLVFRIPSKAKATKLQLSEVLDNSNHLSRPLIFDLTDMK